MEKEELMIEQSKAYWSLLPNRLELKNLLIVGGADSMKVNHVLNGLLHNSVFANS